MTPDHWRLTWPRGSAMLFARGGMLGGVRLKLDDNRWVAPLYEAPWLNEGQPVEPALLENLRSEFVCVPYGTPHRGEPVANGWQAAVRAALTQELDASDLVLHGYGAQSDWSLVEQTDTSLEISVDYPTTSAIRRLTRKVIANSAEAALDFTLTVDVRRPCMLSIGVHPSFALPETPGAFHMVPSRFAFGLVHPAGPEPRLSRALAGAEFRDIGAVPMLDGRTQSFNRLPLREPSEEVFMLCGSDGRMQLEDHSIMARYELSWNPKHFPSVLLWISNRGRPYPPWNGRNLCVGVEPVAAAFLGAAVSRAPNPISKRGVATAIAFSSPDLWTTEYRMEAHTLQSPI